MSSSRVTAPTNYLDLITVRDAEQHLHLTENEDAAYVASLIPMAIDLVEEYTGRAVLLGTYKLTLDYFPYYINVPKPPLNTLTSVTYYDNANSLQTVDSGNYFTTDADEMSNTVIEPITSYSWPSTYTRKGAVVVNYTAGYAVQDVPTAMRQAALVLIGEMYDSRSQTIEKKYTYNRTFENLLAPYVVRSV